MTAHAEPLRVTVTLELADTYPYPLRVICDLCGARQSVTRWNLCLPQRKPYLHTCTACHVALLASATAAREEEDEEETARVALWKQAEQIERELIDAGATPQSATIIKYAIVRCVPTTWSRWSRYEHIAPWATRLRHAADLLAVDPRDLLSIPMMGPKRMRELQVALDRLRSQTTGEEGTDRDAE